MMADQTIARVQPVRTEAYLDFFQMATGVGLVAFMWAHMILVASVNLDLGGGRVMNLIAHFFEATYMAQIGGPMIALVMLLHFVLAARKLPFRATRTEGHVEAHRQLQPHSTPGLWIIQAVTAFIILIMGCIHMWTVLTNLPITAAQERRQDPGRMVAAVLHRPAPDDRTPRGHRHLPHRSQVGLDQESQPQGTSRLREQAHRDHDRDRASSPCSPSTF